METNKIIDAIREIVGEYVNEAKSEYLEARKLEKILEKHLQPSKPEIECKCKGGRHCEVCRKADSGGASEPKKIEELDFNQENISALDIIADKLNEVIQRINDR